MTNGIYKAVLPVFLFLAGCTEKADTGLSGDGGSVPLLVAGRLYGYDGTDSGILHGSEHIGVYMEEYPSAGRIAYSNLGYTATYGTYDEYFNPDDYGWIPFFSENDGRKWTVWAYYPYKEDMEGYIVVSVSDQSRLKETDLLYARVTGLDYSNNTAWLNLAPALSKLHFVFEAGVGVESLSGMSAWLSGFPTIGNFDLSTCHFTADGNSSGRIDMVMSGDEHAADALVLPYARTDGYVAEISVPGEPVARSFRIDGYISGFERGMQYDFTVTVNRSSLDIAVSSAPIAGWHESGTVEVSGEAE